MRWGNIVIGAMGLAILQGIVSGKGASNVGGFLSKAGTAVRWFVDPTVPAFTNTTVPSTSQQSAQASYTPPATSLTYAGGVTNPSPQTVAQGGAV